MLIMLDQHIMYIVLFVIIKSTDGLQNRPNHHTNNIQIGLAVAAERLNQLAQLNIKVNSKLKIEEKKHSKKSSQQDCMSQSNKFNLKHK